MFENTIENLSNSLIKNTQKIIQIPSVHSESDNPNEPFGKNVAKALDYMLKLGESLGFRTKNIDGYCGYIEFGEGKEMLGIIGHLDVVPEGDGWTYPPFSATIADNKIFGRGAIDDKGPVMASLYAMKTVMENCKVNKRVRLILGLNEERDWKCIEYYKKHEELPTVGFSPDADFPCIYAEKGIASSYLHMNYTPSLEEKIKIISIDCNNNAINVVPKYCKVTLQINPKELSVYDFTVFTQNLISENNYNIDIVQTSGSQDDNSQSNDIIVTLTSIGVQAHAAHPDLGVNAISPMIVLLNSIFQEYDCSIDIFDFFTRFIGTKYTGEDLDINFKDESGILTLNVGDFKLENSTIKIGINLRIPVHTELDLVEHTFKKFLSTYSTVSFETTRYQEPLYIPKDNYLIKTLCNIFNEETNSNCEPIAIGGGTFARAFNNCVCFGTNFPGNKDMCHQTDEFIQIENLILACKIYTKAIYELTK